MLRLVIYWLTSLLAKVLASVFLYLAKQVILLFSTVTTKLSNCLNSGFYTNVRMRMNHGKVAGWPTPEIHLVNNSKLFEVFIPLYNIILILQYTDRRWINSAINFSERNISDKNWDTVTCIWFHPQNFQSVSALLVVSFCTGRYFCTSKLKYLRYISYSCIICWVVSQSQEEQLDWFFCILLTGCLLFFSSMN